MTVPNFGRLTAAPLRPGRGGGGAAVALPSLREGAQISDALANLSATLARVAQSQDDRADRAAIREGAGAIEAEDAMQYRSVTDAEKAGAVAVSSDQARFTAQRTFGRAKAALYEADARRELEAAFNNGPLAGSTNPKDVADFLRTHIAAWRKQHVGNGDVESERAFNEETTPIVARLLAQSGEVQNGRMRKRQDAAVYASVHASLMAAGTSAEAATAAQTAIAKAIADGVDPLLVQDASARALRAAVLEKKDGTFAAVADALDVGGIKLRDIATFADQRADVEAQADNLRLTQRARGIQTREYDRGDAWFSLNQRLEADLLRGGMTAREIARKYEGEAQKHGLLMDLNEWSQKANAARQYSDEQVYKDLSTMYGRETLTWQAVTRARDKLAPEDFGRFMQLAQNLTDARRARANALREGAWYLFNDPVASGWQQQVRNAITTKFGGMADANGAFTELAAGEFRALSVSVAPDEQTLRSLDPKQRVELIQGLVELAVDRARAKDPEGVTTPMIGSRQRFVPTDPTVRGMLERAPAPRTTVDRPRMPREHVEALSGLVGDSVAFSATARRLGYRTSIDQLKRRVQQDAELWQQIDADAPAPRMPGNTGSLLSPTTR